MSSYEVTDLVSLAMEKNPTEFKKAFADVMSSKLADALEVRKQEIAGSYLSRDELDDTEDFEADDGQEDNNDEKEVADDN